MRWPTDGPSYDNATKMFSIKNVRYQRINYETFFKLWSSKYKPHILVTMVTKQNRLILLFFVKIHIWYSKEVFVPN